MLVEILRTFEGTLQDMWKTDFCFSVFYIWGEFFSVLEVNWKRRKHFFERHICPAMEYEDEAR